MTQEELEAAARVVFTCLRPTGGLRLCDDLRGAWLKARIATGDRQLTSPELVAWAEGVLGQKKREVPGRSRSKNQDFGTRPALAPGRFAQKYAGVATL
jgi:hypothetical protein